MTLPNYPNQGHQIVLTWNNQANLRNWTAYLGADGRAFYPPYDRDGFSDGITRNLPTGGTFQSGRPISRLTFPWVSDGQIQTLEAFNNEEVTIAIHAPGGIGVNGVTQYNAVFNFDRAQLRTLGRKHNGYVGVYVDCVIVEDL